MPDVATSLIQLARTPSRLDTVQTRRVDPVAMGAKLETVDTLAFASYSVDQEGVFITYGRYSGCAGSPPISSGAATQSLDSTPCAIVA
ncbi:hypothetical protein GCM10023232_08720 [Sphingosinicella ginsenosidimutans]